MKNFILFSFAILWSYAQAFSQVEPLDYYVDREKGDCINNGHDNPWLDFSCFDINDLPDGAIINVAPNSEPYTENHSSYDNSLIRIRDRKNITIRRDPAFESDPEKVIFSGGANHSVCSSEPSIVQHNGNLQHGIHIQPGSSEDIIENIIIEGIQFINFYENAIKIRGRVSVVEKVTVLNCYFSDIIGIKSNYNCTLGVTDKFGTSCAAIHADHCDGLYIEDCTIELIYPTEIGRAAQTDGIYMAGCKDMELYSNHIKLKNDFGKRVQEGSIIKDLIPHIDCIQAAMYEEYENDVLVYWRSNENIIIDRNTLINNGEVIIDNNPYLAHRQGIHITGTDGYIEIYNNIIESARGNGLMNIILDSYNTLSADIFNNTLVGKEEQQFLAEFKLGFSEANFNIKNNIFYKQNAGAAALLKFPDISSANMSNDILNYNLYYIFQGTSTPRIIFSDETKDYNDDPSKFESAGRAGDPKFEDYVNRDFKLKYDSPAKNTGLALLNSGVITDKFGNSRPYWNKDFDIGAYEIEDTQLKLGVAGDEPPPTVTYTLTSYGAYWENNGSWSLSDDQVLEGSSIPTSKYDSLYEYEGWELKWMDRSNNNQTDRIGSALYKITNSENSDYIYLDLRDAITTYGPNVYIHYNFGSQANRYEYFDGTVFQPVANESLLRIWDITNGGNYNTSLLNSYRQNCLVDLEKNNHPWPVWAPFSSAPVTYTLKRKDGEDPWGSLGTFTTTYDYEDTDLQIIGGDESSSALYAQYKVEIPSVETNTIGYWVEGRLEKRNESNSESLSYGLMQNYPNPFNPTTTISFSIAKPEHVTLKIYDILGREVKTLVNEKLDAGVYDLTFNALEIASGIYIYRLNAGKFTEIRKMQLIK